jgi:hypothetical protein
MSTFSTNLKIELIGTGEQTGTWGDTTNDNFSNVFEEAIVGRGNPDFATDGTLTLSYSDSVTSQIPRNLYLNVTSSVSGGLTATRNLVVPTINKSYIVENNTTGGQSIVVKTSAGTGVTIPNGYKCAVYVDGTNVVGAFDYLVDGLNPRAILIADATSVTINADVTDMAFQLNTQAAGTLTINAPTGTLVNGQKLIFRLKSTNSQTLSWNAVFQGSSDLGLPTASSGGDKFDYMGFIYNTNNSKWQIVAKVFGY